MKQHIIPYVKILMYITIIIVMAFLSGYICMMGKYSYLIISLAAIVYCVYKLFAEYTVIGERLMFIFNAVKNNDYSFRFAENPGTTKHPMVNYSLNRIKEVLDHAKLQIQEKERYFELIMECANVGIITIMENGAVMQTNTQAVQMLGLPRLCHIDQLRPISNELCQALHRIRPSERITIHFFTELGVMNLLLSCSEMQFENHRLRVVSLGNINDELDRKEVESWEKLTRILTHEIMNSLAPITSISHTLMTGRNDEKNIQQGLETIHSTSDRLMQFVNSFRAVTRVPVPQRAPFYLSELIDEIISLTADETINIEVKLEPADTMLYADRSLTSQVMLNLIKNAAEALYNKDTERVITIHSTLDAEEHIIIEVTNNGPAIPNEVAENIFTPFFTTKTDGSGIGLAVSRQIVRLHNGSLRLKHNEDGRVTFAIVME